MIIKREEPFSCIYCGSSNITAGHMDGESLQRDVTCSTCNRSWKESAKIYEIEIPKKFVDAYAKQSQISSLVEPEPPTNFFELDDDEDDYDLDDSHPGHPNNYGDR